MQNLSWFQNSNMLNHVFNDLHINSSRIVFVFGVNSFIFVWNMKHQKQRQLFSHYFKLFV